MKAAVIGIISALATMVFSQSGATSQNPGFKNRQYQKELADAYKRIDPSKDGWESEAQSLEYQIVLEYFLDALLHQRQSKYITTNFKSTQLLKPKTNIVFQNAGLTVRRISEIRHKYPITQLIHDQNLSSKPRLR